MAKDNEINNESIREEVSENIEKKYRNFEDLMINILRKIDYINPEDIPNIDLYMDQVTTFVDEQLASLKRFDDDKMLTKTMINNYTKSNLLPPSNKKKYSKDHMILLIYIYYLKSVLPISDIKEIINPLTDKFFKTDKDIDLSQIYDIIFQIEKNNSRTITKDIFNKYKFANKTFEDMDDDNEDKQFLVDYSFICMLCFDVYIKKTMIEKLIDESILRKYTNNKEE